MIHSIKEVLMGDTFTSAAATLALFSPMWLPMLQDVSAFAALLLPILGGLWLIVQIWSKVFKGK